MQRPGGSLRSVCVKLRPKARARSVNHQAAEQFGVEICRLLREHVAAQRNLRHLLHTYWIQKKRELRFAASTAQCRDRSPARRTRSVPGHTASAVMPRHFSMSSRCRRQHRARAARADRSGRSCSRSVFLFRNEQIKCSAARINAIPCRSCCFSPDLGEGVKCPVVPPRWQTDRRTNRNKSRSLRAKLHKVEIREP